MILKKYKENYYARTLFLFLLIWFVLSNRFTLSMFETHKNIVYVGLLLVYLLVLMISCRETDDYCLLMGGFLFQFIFITQTAYTTSCHDLGAFQGFGSSDMGAGHLGYVGYIYNHGQLPDTNPMWVWGYYNPPLHYILMAIWLKINVAFGIPNQVCLENLQLLTMLYSMLSLCIFSSILKELDISEKVKKMWIMFLSFFPFFFYISGALGNDILSILFSLIAVLYTLRWYKQNSLKNIIILAFAIGLGMMTKINVGLIAPAIAFVFLYVLWTRRKEWKKLLPQFVVFGLICVPLGLWWSIRCFLLYEMPIGYVQPLLASPIDVSWYTATQRFFPIKEVWLHPFMDYNKYTITYDYGIITTLLKSSLFCAYQMFAWEDWEYQLCRVSVFLLLALLLIGIGIFIWQLYKHIRHKDWKDIPFWFATIAFIVQIGMYIHFVFEFPNVSSADFRYIAPSLAYFIILTKETQNLSQSEKGVIIKDGFIEFINLVIILFVITTTFIYTIYLMGLNG